MMKLNLQMFAAPGSTSALREETFDNLQLNVGIFVKNFDYSELTDAAAVLDAIDDELESGENLLGATRGGGAFNVSREMRTPQVDGLRYRFKGGNFVDSSDPYISTSLVEATPQNFATALGAELDTEGKVTTLKMPTGIADSAYLDNLCWVGDLADGRVVLIRLDNALNTANFNFTFTDKGEGVMSVEFHACQGSVHDYDYAPFEVVWFGTDEEAEAITWTSAAGTNVGGTKITTTHSKGSGNKYVYKIGNTAPAITNEPPDYTWTEWDGSADIAVGTGNNGKKITIAEVNTSGHVVASGNVTLVVKTA